MLSDGVAPRRAEFSAAPRFVASLIWGTDTTQQVGTGEVIEDRTKQMGFVPDAGGSRLMIVTFPPDSRMTRTEFDAAASGAVFARLVPALAETFESDHPGMHATDSIDYEAR